MVNRISDFDKRIVADLEANGLVPYSSLAERYGVSERTIYRRIKRLQSQDLIRFIVTPNFLLLGYKIWARLGIGVCPGQLHSVANTLKKDPRVYFLAYMLGRYDIMLSVYFQSIDELTNFVNLELVNHKGIRFVETMLLVQPRKYGRLIWPEPISKESERASAGNHQNNRNERSSYQLDNVERKILETMVSQGPLVPRRMSAILGVNESIIRNRLRKMQKAGIYKIEVVPMGDELESGNRATIGITVHNQSPHKVIDRLLSHPEVTLASVALGRFNVIMGVHLRSISLLDNFITDTLLNIEGVTSSETFLHIKRIKYYSILVNT